MWARRHAYVGLRHTIQVPEWLRDALQGARPLKPGPLAARVAPAAAALRRSAHLEPGALRPGAAFPMGGRPPCPVSQFALYQVGETTVILSNRDASAAVEMYATPCQGGVDLLRAVTADLIAGFYGASAGAAVTRALEGSGVPPGTSVAVQVFSAGRHLITAMKGHEDAPQHCADAVATVDAMVQLTVCSGGKEGAELVYQRVNTLRARRRVLL